MAVPSYTHDLDTMVSTAIDTYSRDPINALTDSGEKFLKAAASQGRVFVVNDAESVRHPIMYDHGEHSSLYKPDQLDGTPTENYLSESATEVLTHAVFNLMSGTRNINMPQSQPAGNVIDYVSSVVKANMMSILNQEEILFTRGLKAGDMTLSTGSPATNSVNRAPCSTDADFSVGYPMSLTSLLYSSSTPHNDNGDANTSTTNESFANIKVDDVAKWQPFHMAATSGTACASLIADLQTAILSASYSESERPTHVYTTLEVFEKMLSLLRASAALPDPVNTNMGKEGTVAFGGVTLDWSRYLKLDDAYDVSEPEGATPSLPIIGMNWNSLRLNTVRAGSPGDGNLGFIRQIGDMQPHPTKSNIFKRVEWKRQWSVDNGRRSFFTIHGNVTTS
jgi:hypothetical protein